MSPRRALLVFCLFLYFYASILLARRIRPIGQLSAKCWKKEAKEAANLKWKPRLYPPFSFNTFFFIHFYSISIPVFLIFIPRFFHHFLFCFEIEILIWRCSERYKFVCFAACALPMPLSCSYSHCSCCLLPIRQMVFFLLPFRYFSIFLCK